MNTNKFAAWVGRLQMWMLQAPVRAKIFGIGLGLVILLSAQMIWHVRNTCRVTMERQLEQQTQAFLLDVSTTAPDAFAVQDKIRLEMLLSSLLEHHPELISLSFLNAGGEVITHASTEQLYAERNLTHVTVPIHNGKLGSLRASVSRRMIHSHINELTWQMLLIAAILALLGGGITWILTQIIVRPIRELVRATAEVRRGNLKARAIRYFRDELGQLTDAFNEMVEAIEQKEAIRAHLIQRVISAQEEERARVAQELHDELGQSMTAIVLGLKNLELTMTDNGKTLCRELREAAVRTTESAHDLAIALSPSALRDFGLPAALEHHTNFCKKRFGIPVSLTVIGFDGTTRLSGNIEVVLYRIVQEAVTNSVKHGRAKSISIVLERRQDSILMTIEDDGSGFDSSDWRLRCLKKKRLGLLGMEERVKSLDGTFTIESDPLCGTTIYIYVNLPLAIPALVAV